MTADELAGVPAPAQTLGVFADDATTAAVDNLARLVGAASACARSR